MRQVRPLLGTPKEKCQLLIVIAPQNVKVVLVVVLLLVGIGIFGSHAMQQRVLV